MIAGGFYVFVVLEWFTSMPFWLNLIIALVFEGLGFIPGVAEILSLPFVIYGWICVVKYPWWAILIYAAITLTYILWWVFFGASAISRGIDAIKGWKEIKKIEKGDYDE